MVRFGRIGPPGVHPHVIHRAQVTPVQVARLFIERVIRGRAGIQGPRLERQQGVHLLQFLVLVGPRTEAGPNGNHQMGIVLVDIIHHFLRALDARLPAQRSLVIGIMAFGDVFHPILIAHLIDITGIHKLHGIPVGVASPILPVLHNAIERHAQFAILVEHVAQFVRTLVAFATLPIAHSPEREHGSLAGQVTKRGNDPVHAAVAVEEIVIRA